jgi:hypothetical protein
VEGLVPVEGVRLLNILPLGRVHNHLPAKRLAVLVRERVSVIHLIKHLIDQVDQRPCQNLASLAHVSVRRISRESDRGDEPLNRVQVQNPVVSEVRNHLVPQTIRCDKNTELTHKHTLPHTAGDSHHFFLKKIFPFRVARPVSGVYSESQREAESLPQRLPGEHHEEAARHPDHRPLRCRSPRWMQHHSRPCQHAGNQWDGPVPHRSHPPQRQPG